MKKIVALIVMIDIRYNNIQKETDEVPPHL